MSNRTIESGALDAGIAPSAAASGPLAGPIVALAPGSGIQFIDGFIPASLVGSVSRRFLEDGSGDQRTLYPIEIEDGALYHPTTLAPLDPRQVELVTGADAIAPFLDRWVPLPYLRVLKRDLHGELALDDGPSNWVRMMVSPDETAAQGRPGGYHVTLAIDTALDARAREMDRPYAMPCLDDARLASVFLCPDDPALLSWFVSEPWVDDWLAGLFESVEASRGAACDRPGRAGFTHERTARYLTLLALVRAAALAPRLRFLDPDKERSGAPVDVDLVIDIGAARTSAILVERGPGAGAIDATTTRHVPLRDLARPSRVHYGPFSSRIEFSRATFGSETISRRSGRAEAFFWPSLARTGSEAERLAGLDGSHDGVTGLESPRKHLREVEPQAGVWRTADPGRRDGDGPMVTSPLLALLTEAGELRSRRRGEEGQALRPRFSRSSTLHFFLAELLLHAEAAIGGPLRLGRNSSANLPRRLGRIIVTTPLGTGIDEQRALQERIETAVDLVAEAMGKASQSGTRGRERTRPEIILGHNEPLAAQAVYLYDAFASRLRGAPGDFFTAMGRSRPDHGIHPSLRIAGLDIGASQTTLTVVTYEASPSALIVPRVALSEASDDGGERVVEAVATAHILPAIEARLTTGGEAETGPALQRLLGPPVAIGDPARERERRRFLTRVAIPLARALVEVHCQLGSARDADEITLDFLHLEAQAGGVSRPAIRWLERRAMEEGHGPLDLLATSLTISRGALTSTISAAIGPTISAACRIAEAYECDLMLVTGWTGQLAEVRSHLIQELPFRPDRVVAMHDHPVGAWYPCRTQDGRIGDTKPMVAVGTALLSRGRTGPLPIDVEPLRQPKETGYLVRLSAATRTADPARLLAFGAPQQPAAAALMRKPQAAITGGGAPVSEDVEPRPGGQRRAKSGRNSKVRSR